jgi:OOP family OmpA-OmpF porin
VDLAGGTLPRTFSRTTGTPRLALLLAALLLGPSVAGAQTDPFIRGFDAVPLKPSPLLDSGVALDGAGGWARGSFRLGFLGDGSINILALRLGDEKLGNLIPYRVDAHLLGSYVLHERVELGVDLPLVLAQGDNFDLLTDQGFPQPGVYSLSRPCDRMFQRGCGLADLRVVPRFTLLSTRQFPVGVAVVSEVRVPIGDGQSFTGDRGWTLAPRAVVEGAVGPVRILGNLGYRFRRFGQFLNLYVGHEFAAGAGAVYRLPDTGPLTRFDLMGEVHLATPTAAPFTFAQSDSLKSPLELLVGARARVHRRWGVELAAGRTLALQSGYGRPDFRVLMGLRYESEFLDRDGDGIPDDIDRCPDDPEDKDGFQDEDGCPDPDNDGDGIPDAEDACPNEPGTADMDGCPDRDDDGLPDHIDKCPDQAGPPELEGCPIEDPPHVILETDRLRLKTNILFETGEAKIQKQSFPVLDEVAQVLQANPNVGPILIEGHTDNIGSRAYNIDLSNRRAKAVLEYLVKKGVDRKRLSAKGFGFDRPVDTNETLIGRAKNRRVEFTITN